jgi:hypothetical protein
MACFTKERTAMIMSFKKNCSVPFSKKRPALGKLRRFFIFNLANPRNTASSVLI